MELKYSKKGDQRRNMEWMKSGRGFLGAWPKTFRNHGYETGEDNTVADGT
jgi:hypothetical protein